MNTSPNMKHLIFATGNEHKVVEIKNILPEDISLKSLNDIGYIDDIEETGSSMHENAFIKANTIFQLHEKPVFAEDSGLEITALDMAPGIYTARYAGSERDHDKNIDKVLYNLKDKIDRSAQFRAVIAYVDEKGVQYFEGIIKGKIGMQRQGSEGFGYDPIFIPEEYEDSFAILGDTVKNEISHRSRAFKKFVEYLK